MLSFSKQALYSPHPISYSNEKCLTTKHEEGDCLVYKVTQRINQEKENSKYELITLSL